MSKIKLLGRQCFELQIEDVSASTPLNQSRHIRRRWRPHTEQFPFLDAN